MSPRGRRQHCEYPDCPNFAQLGARFCRAHRNTPVPAEVEDRPYWQYIAEQEEAEREKRRAEFRRRLDEGDYRKLFGAKIGAMLDDAAKEQGADLEIGALRIVLAKLVSELDDTETPELARAVATVTRAIAYSQRSQKVVSGGLVEGLTEWMHGILEELDRGE